MYQSQWFKGKQSIVLILDGNSDHVAHVLVLSKRNPMCDCSRSNQMTQSEQITKITPCAPISVLPSNISTMFFIPLNQSDSNST